MFSKTPSAFLTNRFISLDNWSTRQQGLVKIGGKALSCPVKALARICSVIEIIALGILLSLCSFGSLVFNVSSQIALSSQTEGSALLTEAKASLAKTLRESIQVFLGNTKGKYLTM